MKNRGVRDQITLATKLTTNFHAGRGDKEIIVNFNGNGSKSLHTSVEASLKKLQTDYIDLLYVHWWDFSASIPELMQSLNHLVAARKVLYLGTSDSPAWVVAKANEYARCNGLRQFSVYQGRWTAAARDFERENIPMCRAEGMGLAPWGALGGGMFKTEEQRQKAQKEGRSQVIEPSEVQVKVSKALEAVVRRKSSIVTSIAQAYVTVKAPYVFPIVGGRNFEHLTGNIEALNIKLSDNDINEIEDALPFDLGFPGNFLYGEKLPENPGAVWVLAVGGTLDRVPEPKPLSKMSDIRTRKKNGGGGGGGNTST